MGFEQRISEHIPDLRRYAQALCRDPAAADDLVQDCLERALRKRHLWRPRGRLRSWLFRILYRIHLNEQSSARVRRESLRADADHTLATEPRGDARVRCGDVVAALDVLPPEQQAALLLMVLEAPSYREAARILDVNVGTLRSRLSRARETLRRHCEGEPAEGERRLRRVK